MQTKPPVPYDLCVADLRMELFEALPATSLDCHKTIYVECSVQGWLGINRIHYGHVEC